MNIGIDAEFKALIPPLSAEEYEQLEKNIIADGCRDPLVTWRGTLIDGHNRYEICEANGITFKTTEQDFDDREAVKIWIIENQFGRRNLPNYTRAKLALELKPLYAAKAKKNQVRTSENRVCQISDKQEQPVDTKKELAKVAGVSHDTIAKVEAIEKKAAPEVKKALASGEVSINQAYKEIKKEEKKAEVKANIEAQKEAIASGKIQMPVGVFEVISLDPPWNYGREYDPEGSRVANPYPEMTQTQLLDLNLPLADDSVCFLWTTHAFIWQAKELLDKWGLRYKATIVWDKEKIGMGAWLRMQCEFCLVGVKGKPSWNNTSWRDIIREPRREHSRKPETFYRMVEEITIGRKLEYFSRERRNGWEVFGNDTEKF